MRISGLGVAKLRPAAGAGSQRTCRSHRWRRRDGLAVAGDSIAGAAQAIHRACPKREEVAGKASFLLCDEGASEEQAIPQIRHCGLGSEDAARGSIDFIRCARHCVFVYRYGGEMLDALLAAQNNRGYWFTRLPTAYVTRGQIQVWPERQPWAATRA